MSMADVLQAAQDVRDAADGLDQLADLAQADLAHAWELQLGVDSLKDDLDGLVRQAELAEDEDIQSENRLAGLLDDLVKLLRRAAAGESVPRDEVWDTYHFAGGDLDAFEALWPDPAGNPADQQ
jgi:hypothetical protein